MKTLQLELETIRDYLTEKIKEDNFKMARPPEDGDEESPLKLVKPKVIIGNIPHENFSMYGATDDRFYQAPYLLVGFETASYGPNEEEVGILIQGCAYTAVEYDHDEEDVAFPDNEGVIDVTQMMERVMQWLRQKTPFSPGMEFTIGNYGTQAYTYPYNFGYLSFKIVSNVGAMPRRDILKY